MGALATNPQTTKCFETFESIRHFGVSPECRSGARSHSADHGVGEIAHLWRRRHSLESWMRPIAGNHKVRRLGVNVVSDISEHLRDFGPLVGCPLPGPVSMSPSRYCRARVLVQCTDSAPFGSLLAFPPNWKTLTRSGS